MMYWNSWMYIFLMIGNLVFWGLVVFAVMSLTRSSTRPEQWRAAPGQGGRDPEQILAERFAHGELDAEEYRMRLRVLREHRPGTPP